MDDMALMKFSRLRARKPARRIAAACALAFLAALGLRAQAATPAEAFVSENIQRGFQILNNRQLTPDQRTTQFNGFLEHLTDIDRVARFTLGAARRGASPEDISAFNAAFKDYAEAIYQSRLSQYSGQTLRVTGSNEHAPGDFIVSTTMVDPNAKSNQQPLQIDFRVLNDNGHMVVIDVAIAGVWLAIEERDQFSAFLSQHGASIPALVAHLKQLTQQLKHGGGPGRTNGR
jgi:phospholipid transport system substrate-binding protein